MTWSSSKTDLQHVVYEHVLAEARRRAAELETLVAEAVALQDFDRLDALHVVEAWDGSWAGVASYWGDTRAPDTRGVWSPARYT